MGCSDSYSTRLFYAERKPLLLRRRALAALPIFKADLAAVPVIGWERRMKWGSGARRKRKRRRYLSNDQIEMKGKYDIILALFCSPREKKLA